MELSLLYEKLCPTYSWCSYHTCIVRICRQQHRRRPHFVGSKTIRCITLFEKLAATEPDALYCMHMFVLL